MTPGNFLAEKTWNGSEKTEASTGAVPWLITGAPFVDSVDGVPTLTKLIFRLVLLAIALIRVFERSLTGRCLLSAHSDLAE